MKLYCDYGQDHSEDLYYYVDKNGRYWEFLDELPPMLLLNPTRELRERQVSAVFFEDAPEWVQSTLNELIELGYVVL
jgi:hypothetical protein